MLCSFKPKPTYVTAGRQRPETLPVRGKAVPRPSSWRPTPLFSIPTHSFSRSSIIASTASVNSATPPPPSPAFSDLVGPLSTAKRTKHYHYTDRTIRKRDKVTQRSINRHLTFTSPDDKRADRLLAQFVRGRSFPNALELYSRIPEEKRTVSTYDVMLKLAVSMKNVELVDKIDAEAKARGVAIGSLPYHRLSLLFAQNDVTSAAALVEKAEGDLFRELGKQSGIEAPPLADPLRDLFKAVLLFYRREKDVNSVLDLLKRIRAVKRSKKSKDRTDADSKPGASPAELTPRLTATIEDYNSILSSFFLRNKPDEWISKVISDMTLHNVPFNSYTYHTLIKYYISQHSIAAPPPATPREPGQDSELENIVDKLVSHLNSAKVILDEGIATTLMYFYGELGNDSKALSVWELYRKGLTPDIPNATPTPPSRNVLALITSVCAVSKDLRNAKQFFHRLTDGETKKAPAPVTLLMALCYARKGSVEKVNQYLAIAEPLDQRDPLLRHSFGRADGGAKISPSFVAKGIKELVVEVEKLPGARREVLEGLSLGT